MTIGVFDSGIGGLTVLTELMKLHPNNKYLYYGDTVHLPYGEKTKDELREYSEKIIKFFIENKVDLIVIACGTISSNLYDEIKDKYPLPIIDILNPTADYIKKNNLKNIGFMATPMTIKSGFFESKLDFKIKSVACPLLVPLIENGKIDEKVISDYVGKLEGSENIVLGCTHYPLLKDIISKYTTANLINMGTCVSESLEIADSFFELNLYFSKVTDILINNIKKILDNKKHLNIYKWPLTKQESRGK